MVKNSRKPRFTRKKTTMKKWYNCIKKTNDKQLTKKEYSKVNSIKNKIRNLHLLYNRSSCTVVNCLFQIILFENLFHLCLLIYFDFLNYLMSLKMNLLD